MRPVIPYVSQQSADEASDWISRLSRSMPDEKIIDFKELSAEQARQADIAIIANPDPADVATLPNLKWVQSVWAGVERILADLGDRSFEIARLIDPELARTMAEAVLAWTLYLHRDMPAYADQQRRKEWIELPYRKPADRTVGILGLGTLGSLSADVLLSQGFKVRGWSRNLKVQEGVETYAGQEGLVQLVEKSDILVNLLPLTSETRGLLDAGLLSKAPSGAGFINFGRGPVVVTEDLLQVLENGPLKHAVLDVFDSEPLPQDSRLWDHPSITVLPHISGPTDLDSAARIVADNISRYRETGELPETVDKGRGY